MTTERQGPFWDMIEGRLPLPPAAKLLGWQLVALDAEKGEITVSFDAKPDFVNPVGTVQGGFIAAMLDDTMGPAAAAFLGGQDFAQTLELKNQLSARGPAWPSGRPCPRRASRQGCAVPRRSAGE